MKRTIKQLWELFKPSRVQVGIIAFVGLMIGVTSVLLTYYIGKSIDVMVNQGNVDFGRLGALMMIMLGILAVNVIMQWALIYANNALAYTLIHRLRTQAIEQLTHTAIKFYDQQAHGDLVSRFTTDLENLADAMIALFTSLFPGMAVIVISLFFMIRSSVWLMMVIILTTPLIFVASYVVARLSQKNFRQQQTKNGILTGYIHEMFYGFRVVKMFGYEKEVNEAYQKRNDELKYWGQKAQFTSSITNPLTRFVSHLTYLLIGVVGGYLMIVKKDPSMTIGVISSFILYSNQFSKPFVELSGIATQIQAGVVGYQRIQMVINQPQTERGTDQEIVALKGEVAFSHVWFGYNNDHPIIKDLNLHVLPGQTVAIVGETGSGKTTLVNLLMRFYDLDQGMIYIDGKPYTEYSKQSVRRAFGMVLQDTWLTFGTIKENIAYGNKDATMEDIIKVAKEAYIHYFIERLPEGYDTVIGSSGVQLSSGQKQLITIARAMLINPSMLILDEATSYVDPLTERHIQSAFLKLMNNRTSFVIAHRLSTIQDSDLILVMSLGRIVEVGTHEELLAIKGYYYTLYQAQFATS